MARNKKQAKRQALPGPYSQGGLRAWARRHAFGFFSSLGQMMRRPISSAMTVVVLALALTLPLGFGWALTYVAQWTQFVDRAPTLSVFLATEAKESDALALSSEWASWDDVLAVDPISPEMGLAETLGYLGVEGNQLAALDNPLPWVLELAPIQEADVATLTARLADHPKVEQVIVDLVWLERLDLIIALGERFVWVLAVLLLMAFVFVIAHTIRLDVHQRRHQIEVMALVGATPAFIRRPFLYSGFWFGLGASLLALVFIHLSLAFVSGPLEALGLSYQSDILVNGPSAGQSIALILGMGMVGVVGSWAAVSQQLSDVWPK